MESYDELPDLKMSALAVLFKNKWSCPAAHKPNDFVVKEALAVLASSLEDDDIGYFYSPNAPRELCTNPGELVGKIANTKLPYNFDFRKGVSQLIEILKAIDDDYNKMGVVVSDCLTEGEAADLMSSLSALKDVKIFVFGIGGCAVTDKMIHLQDALELHDSLKCVRESFGFR
jgi:hypothetical protein